MNRIAESQVEDVLSSFTYDSTGQEEDNIIRKKERQDSHIFLFRDYYNIRTKDGVLNTSFLEPQKNTFGRRKRWQENCRVSLTSFDRSAFDILKNEKDKAQFLVKFFNRERYSRVKRERYIINYFAHASYYDEELMEEFLAKYFAMEKYTKDEREQFRAKCFTREQVTVLTKKGIKQHTYLDEESCMSSLIDTIEECIQSGETLIIVEGKSEQANQLVHYLKYLQYEQQITNLLTQKEELDNACECIDNEILSLKQQLRILEEKRKGIKEKISQLEEDQSSLEEEQDNL